VLDAFDLGNGTAPRRELAAVILTAGAGRRLGGVAKALLRTTDGRTFLAKIVATARDVGVVDAVVVVGPPHGEVVSALARELGCRVVVNPAPERGMASSVAVGFAALGGSKATAAWLWPVDHPHVSVATLELLIAAIDTHAGSRPMWGGRGGHPPLVARSLWPQLASCGDVDGGARAILANADVVAVPVGDRGVVRDIDTPADLEAP
jgi:CTP:molybdopterin cytidylyltransferase MocA